MKGAAIFVATFLTGCALGAGLIALATRSPAITACVRVLTRNDVFWCAPEPRAPSPNEGGEP